MSLIDFAGFDNQPNNYKPPFFDPGYFSPDNNYDYSTDTRYNSGRSLYSAYVQILGTKTFTESSEVIFGFAAKTTDSGGSYFVRFGNSDFSVQCELWFMNSGKLRAYRNAYLTGTLIYESSNDGLFNVNVWNYYEIKMKLSNTVGAFEVRINNKVLATATGLDNLYSGTNENISNLSVNIADPAYLDDVYILNTSGSQNNDFLGEIIVDTLYPTANGNQNDGVASTGSNYECVDDPQFNDDTDYVTLDAVNEIELYALGDLPTTDYTKEIFAIKVTERAKKNDAGTRGLQTTLRINNTNYQSSDTRYLGLDYFEQYDYWELNPDDSSAWEEADINALEIGVKVVE